MTRKHAETMAAFWSAFEGGHFDRIESELMAPDIEFVMPGVPPQRGIAAVRALWEAWRGAFPDMRHETLHAVEGPSSYAAETRFSGTHTGTMQSPQGEVPPTGRTIKWTSADIVRLDPTTGRIGSWHVYHDPMALLGQLGLLAGP
jgi:predicted ester cyclase